MCDPMINQIMISEDDQIMLYFDNEDYMELKCSVKIVNALRTIKDQLNDND